MIHWLVAALLGWILHSMVVMISVAAVSRGNRHNTLGRAMLVSLLTAVLVPAQHWWWFIIPMLIALVVWTLIYAFAYGLGMLQSLAAAVVQAFVGWLIIRLVMPLIFSGYTGQEMHRGAMALLQAAGASVA